MAEQTLTTKSGPLDLIDHTERNLGTVALPHAAGGAWSFRTVGCLIEHASYQSVSETSGRIMPIFGLSMSGRGTGGGYVAGGGGLISSRTKEWCRLVARRGDGRTFSTEGGCELALQQGSQLFHSTVRIGNTDREFLLFNPDSEVSQLKMTADDITQIRTFNPKTLLWYLIALACIQAGAAGALLGLLLAAIPSWDIYKWWTSRRQYHATKAQIEESIALVAADFRNRLRLA